MLKISENKYLTKQQIQFDLLDSNKIRSMIGQGSSRKDLMLEFPNVTDYYIEKFIAIHLPDLFDLYKENNKEAQKIVARITYKNGQHILYKRLRAEIRRGQHPCKQCGSLKNVEIHHLEQLNYDEAYRYWKADNFNNDPNNIEFLCNSCHQKLHYRELGKECKVKQDPKTGRWLKK